MAYLICIDPGHAKNTAGKRSFDSKLMEYEFNRDVAKRLKRLLERHGLNTMYSCDIDEATDTPLGDRCKAANEAKASLFISIHANAYGTTWNSANGWEVFCHKSSERGRELAECIQDASIPELGLQDRGIKTDSLYVINHTSMPAVLVEHGFYTSKTEVQKLLTDTFREECAIADAKGILAYLGMEWKDLEEGRTLYRVQVGAFSKKENAQKLVAELKGKGYDACLILS